jgi:hypothetical protein
MAVAIRLGQFRDFRQPAKRGAAAAGRNHPFNELPHGRRPAPGADTRSFFNRKRNSVNFGCTLGRAAPWRAPAVPAFLIQLSLISVRHFFPHKYNRLPVR